MQNLRFRKNLCNPHAVALLAFAPALAKVRRQLPCQFCHHLLALLASLPLQQFGVDAAPDMPVKLGEFGIDRDGHLLAGRLDKLPQLGKQRFGQGLGWCVHCGFLQRSQRRLDNVNGRGCVLLLRFL